MRIEILGELRQDPFVNPDNCALDDEALAIRELMAFEAAGGATVVDPTCPGIGRDPEALVRIARATGLNVVTGAGYYLETSHPPELAGISVDAIADEIVAEAQGGIDGVRIGLIGETGVSADFTEAVAEAVLRNGAAERYGVTEKGYVAKPYQPVDEIARAPLLVVERGGHDGAGAAGRDAG